MAKVAFTDNLAEMAQCRQDRSYNWLSQLVRSRKNQYTGYVAKDAFFAGYTIGNNKPLTELYGFPCYVVKFSFAEMETNHLPWQEELLEQLCRELSTVMQEKKGYYNLRIPSHMVDLIRALNGSIRDMLFCGGTMHEMYTEKRPAFQTAEKDPQLRIFFPDCAYIREHEKQLLAIAYSSFADYSSQYHISPVTAPKAGKIYENWMERYFRENSGGPLMVAELGEKPVGYHLLEESDRYVEGVLVSVNEENRGHGVYRAIISRAIQYAEEKGKTFVTSTQMDNYITQGTCGSLGMRQLYGIYNFHFRSF